MENTISKKEKNIELFKLWKEKGDNSITKENLPFIYSCADEIYFSRSAAQRARISRQEVRHEGAIGWFKGLEKFDINMGYAITTYTKFWIKAYALIFCKNQHQIKIGTTNQKNKAIVALMRDSQKYLDKDGKEDLQKLAEANGLDLNIVLEIQDALKTKFVNFEVNDHENSIASDAIFYRGTGNPENLLDLKEKLLLLQDSKKELLDQFPNQIHQDLINLVILPESGEPLTLEEVAKKNGFLAKQNVAPWKNMLQERLVKKFLERYYGYGKKSHKTFGPSASQGSGC